MSEQREELKKGVKEFKNVASYLLQFLKFSTLTEPKLSDAASFVGQKITTGIISTMLGGINESLTANITEGIGYGLIVYGLIDAVGVGIRWFGDAK